MTTSINLDQRPGWMDGTGVHPALRLGAHLATLHLALATSPIRGLLADRIALLAAIKNLSRAGRTETLADLRDMRMLDEPAGPAAPILSAWTWLSHLPWEETAATRFRRDRSEIGKELADPRHLSRLQSVTFDLGLRDPTRAANLAFSSGAAAALSCPLSAAGTVIDATIELPVPVRLFAIDYVIGRCCGWPLPIYSLGLGRRASPQPHFEAIAEILLAGVVEVTRILHPLTARASDLLAAAHQVRTAQRHAVIARILAQDAVCPAGLCDLLPPRHSRRLLLRLVNLGALRELTGRPTYRLYGL